MKTFKRMIALLLTAILCMAMVIPTMADEEGTKKITLTGGKAGHTYTLYQVFKGDVDATTGELTNIQWGDNAPDALKTEYATAAAAAKAIGEEDDARAFAQKYTFIGGTEETLTADGDVEFTGLEEGYYVIIDTKENTEVVEGDYFSAIIVKVVKDVEGKIKGSAPSSKKKVADNNDSEKVQPALEEVEDDAWQDSADYDIGDAVPFELTATTADNVSAYKKYHITFQDNYSEGLGAPETFLFNVLGEDITYTGEKVEAYTVKTKITIEPATPDAGQVFAIKVTFEPVEGEYLDKECEKADIVAKYTQVLNNSAKFGTEGNPNTSYIKYSSNPESTDDSEEGKTPEDKVIVFTYKTTVDKVDETGAALTGAEFALYKVVLEGTEGAVTGESIKDAMTDDVKAKAAVIEDEKFYKAVTLASDSTESQFKFKGIDDGTYVLVETKVPDGYNAWAGKSFTVAAEHDVEEDDPQLISLTGTDPFNAANDWASSIEITKKNESKYTTESGELYAEIENNSGAELPETGGMGTTLFYVFGAILVLGAGVVLISRRRMEA